MTRFLLLFMAILTAKAAAGAPLQFKSSTRQTALIELYTSEGCSSCPPAEAWLGKLKAEAGLWNDFVPIAFHIDYWDYLGWRDKWSNKQFSERQQSYAQLWGGENVYTPEFVLNGKEWRGWRGFRALPSRGGEAGVLGVGSEDTNRWQVKFLPASRTATTYEVHAALLV